MHAFIKWCVWYHMKSYKKGQRPSQVNDPDQRPRSTTQVNDPGKTQERPRNDPGQRPRSKLFRDQIDNWQDHNSYWVSSPIIHHSSADWKNRNIEPWCTEVHYLLPHWLPSRHSLTESNIYRWGAIRFWRLALASQLVILALAYSGAIKTGWRKILQW